MPITVDWYVVEAFMHATNVRMFIREDMQNVIPEVVGDSHCHIINVIIWLVVGAPVLL